MTQKDTMEGKGRKILFISVIVVVGTYFLFLGLSKAQGFLAPLTTAVILALLMLPLAQKMERGVMNRPVSSLLNTFIIFLASVAFMAVISFQVKSFVDDWPEIKETMKPKIEDLKSWIFEHTPLQEEDLNQESGSGGEQQAQQGQQESQDGTEQTGEESGGIAEVFSSNNTRERAVSFFNKTINFFADYLLTFIYIFFLLNYRHRFKVFLLKLFPDEKRDEVESVIQKSAHVTQKYLVGKLFLILLLAILYSTGLGISGVDNFILVSVIAAFLSLVPYIGNIIGFGMAMAFGYLSSGETGVLIGIIITFGVAQFVESYILEPYIVGDQVDLHPFFVIVAVILGGMVWGVIGMILAIPVLGILNVVFRNIKPLKPFGYLLGNQED